MSDCSIPSSSGRESVTFSMGKRCTTANGERLAASVRIQGLFWDRAIDIEEARLTEDYQFYVPQVMLIPSELDLLIRSLSSWLDSPREICHELGDGQDQIVKLSIGRIDELICQFDKPALTLEYSGGSCRCTRFSFLVDRTCIDSFFRELQRAR